MEKSIVAFLKITPFSPEFHSFAIAVIAVFVAVRKFSFERYNSKKDRISELLCEIEKIGTPKYHYTIEQLFLNRYGFIIDYPVINFLLRSKTPSTDFLNYVYGKTYLIFCAEHKVFKLKNAMIIKGFCFKKCFFLLISVSSAYVAFAGIFLIDYLEFDFSNRGRQGFILYIFTLINFMVISYTSLSTYFRLNQALKLYRKYKK
ncbi:hypothetical protein [Pseudoalteromonas phenolica]|uniref:hypothetical protein n=1 Tax=Pseudoalteromonas phenolica TaxID=161398 RepID=UPI003850F7D0